VQDFSKIQDTETLLQTGCYTISVSAVQEVQQFFYYSGSKSKNSAANLQQQRPLVKSKTGGVLNLKIKNVKVKGLKS